MPMSAGVLGALLQSNIDALSDEDKKTRPAVFEAMAAAIIAHIQSAATVAVTVASVSGVTTGPGTSGPGSGIGTIT